MAQQNQRLVEVVIGLRDQCFELLHTSEGDALDCYCSVCHSFDIVLVPGSFEVVAVKQTDSDQRQ